MPQTEINRPPIRLALAYLVHLFTASGVVFGFVAIESIVNNEFREAFLWMGAALLVDMVDGTFARAVGVKELLPGFDGALLDNMTDYFNYVIVPAVFLYHGAILPEHFRLVGVAGICLSSAYQFCQKDAKTSDHYFRGFPSYWNVTVIYLLLLGTDERLNLAVLALLVVLVFVPIKYIYPSRTERFRRTSVALTTLWAAVMLGMLYVYPHTPLWLVQVSLIYVAYYFGISLFIEVSNRLRG